MKNLKYSLLGCLIVLGATSCKKWLNVNTDPNHPNNQSVLVQNRLPWLQHFFTYSEGVSNFRAAMQAGVYYSGTASANALGITWTANTGNITSYQTFFDETASNLPDMYSAAQAKGAYYYMAAADVFSAMGFMEMTDLYGEMPYTQAVSGNPSPKYDDGKTIYNGCMAKLNEAIGLFSKTQASTAPSFAAGDMWLGGNPAAWIKFCYGLKARYMLRISKKTDLFNADSILYCLSQGPQSNADNVIQAGYNNSTVTDYLEGDPVVTNGNWDYAGEGSNQRISQFYYNLLTNMRGAGVVDPRMTKIVPASMGNVVLNAGGTVQSYTWNRSVGVDFYGPSTRLLAGGPASIITASFATKSTNITYTISDPTAFANFVAAQTAAGHTFTTSGSTVTVTYPAGAIYINSSNYLFAGDTVYVNCRSASMGYSNANATQPANNVNWYPSAAAYNAGVVGSTGSFQIRPVSPFEVLTYHEMCFIKAEAEMRKGDAADAYTAYLAGINAHINFMQAQLSSWQAGGFTTSNPDMAPMKQSDITNYLASAAIAPGAGGLTMSDIMLQKYVAMGISIENLVDMRRFDFSAGDVGSYGVVYPGYGRSPLFAGSANYTGTSVTDPRYWPRRWALPTNLEINYNLTNVLALNPHATDLNIWSMPVWWDCATDAQYYGYLKP